MRGLEKLVESGGRNFLLRVETSLEAKDYQKYEDVRNEVWGYPDDHFSATRNMMCENFLHEGSSLFIGVFALGRQGPPALDRGSMAGFCYGYVGLKDKAVGFRDPRNLRFYSQFTAVRKEFQNLGLGILLKEFQREKLLDLFGIGETICTYDPLTGVNAHRNVHHFGMELLEYRVATYGEYGGLLNRSDVPTDRFLMSWDLGKGSRPGPAKIPPGLKHAVFAETVSVEGKAGVLDLELVREADPDLDGNPVLVQIPSDFYRMLQETDVAEPAVRSIPVEWRLQTRRVFQRLFARGYRVTDFGRAPEDPGRGCYLLALEGD
jgi:predicted GNAT superfamily acetyltransferase